MAPAVVLLSPLLVLGLTPTVLIQATWLDPYVYTAYIHDYRQTFLRYGETYYSNRISAIDLSRLVLLFIHSDASYYVARLVLLVAVCTAMFMIARRFYSTTVAALAVILLCFSPWYMRAIASNYVDGIAITYLFIALAFLIVPTRHLVWGHIAAGIFFGLMVNTNLWALAFAGCFAPSWYVLHRRQGGLRLTLLAIATVCGLVAMYVVLGVAMHHEFPSRPLFFEGKTLETALDQLGPARNGSFRPLKSLLFPGPRDFLLVPLVLCVTMLFVMGRVIVGRIAVRSQAFVLASGAYLIATTVLYLVAHLGFHHSIIGYTYYFSYSLVSSFLAMVALIGEAAEAAPSKTALPLLAGAAGIYVLEYALYSEAFTRTRWPLWIWAATAVVLPLDILLDKSTTRRLAVVLLCLLALPIPFYHSAEDYALLHSRTQTAEEWDVYHGARFFQSVVGRVAAPPGVVKFWYGEGGAHKNLDSIQSMYLWGFSRVAPMPRVDQEFLEATSKARYLVLLGLSNREIEGGMEALAAARIPFKEISHDQFTGKKFSFQFATLELIEHRRATK